MVPVRTTCVKKPSRVKVWVRNCFSTVAMKTWLKAPRKSRKHGCLVLCVHSFRGWKVWTSTLAHGIYFSSQFEPCTGHSFFFYQQYVFAIRIWTWLRCNRNSNEGYLIGAGRDNAVETQVFLFKLEDFLCNSSLIPYTICKYNKWNLTHLASSGAEALELRLRLQRTKRLAHTLQALLLQRQNNHSITCLLKQQTVVSFR